MLPAVNQSRPSLHWVRGAGVCQSRRRRLAVAVHGVITPFCVSRQCSFIAWLPVVYKQVRRPGAYLEVGRTGVPLLLNDCQKFFQFNNTGIAQLYIEV